MNINKKYQDLLSKIYNEGFEYEDSNRKGVVRRQIPYYTLEHKFSDGFPIIGLKQSYPKMAFNEMIAFMGGITNLKQLEELGVTFWRKDAYNYYKEVCKKTNSYVVSYDTFMYYNQNNVEHDSTPFREADYKDYGDLGKIYSHQIRNWNGEVDQLNEVLERLKKEPNSTKNIITMWNPSDMDSCALSPCHTRLSFIVENLKNGEKGLTVQWNQDSVDTFLGLPINILYYSNVCYTFAHYLGMKPLGILGNLTNCHLYDNSWESTEKLLSLNSGDLKPIEVEFELPTTWTSLNEYLEQLSFYQVNIKEYRHLGRFDVEMLPYNK